MIDRNRDAPKMMPPTTQSQKQVLDKILVPEKNPDASYSFGKGKPQIPQNRGMQMQNKSPNNRIKPRGPIIPVLDDEEPICVLKVELDGGENIQHIKVYEG